MITCVFLFYFIITYVFYTPTKCFKMSAMGNRRNNTTSKSDCNTPPPKLSRQQSKRSNLRRPMIVIYQVVKQKIFACTIKRFHQSTEVIKREHCTKLRVA